MSPRNPKPNSRANHVYNELLAMALKSGPNSKLPTVKEICLKLPTNQVTLRSALDALEAKKIIYRRQGSGIYVSPKIHHKSIAIALEPTFFEQPGLSPFWGMLWGLLTREAQIRAERDSEEFSFHLVTEASEGGTLPSGLRQAILDRTVDGVISVGLAQDVASWIMSTGVPSVGYANMCDYDVLGESKEIVSIGVETLADLGRRRIGYLAPAAPFREIEANNVDLPTFKESLSARGLTFYPELYWDNRSILMASSGVPAPIIQSQGHDAIMSLFTNPTVKPPDGLVVLDDMMCWGALAAIPKLGLRLGEDVTIATHANKGSTIFFGYEEDLVLIEFDAREIVRELFDVMEILTSGRTPEQETVVIHPTLRIGHNLKPR